VNFFGKGFFKPPERVLVRGIVFCGYMTQKYLLEGMEEKYEFMEC
jgi:hypothetical protein